MIYKKVELQLDSHFDRRRGDRQDQHYLLFHQIESAQPSNANRGGGVLLQNCANRQPDEGEDSNLGHGWAISLSIAYHEVIN